MIPALIAVGVAYLLLRDRDSGTTVDEPSSPDEDPFIPPQPVPDQFDDMAEETIEKVYSGDGFAVFKIGFLQGLKYDDGTDNRRYDFTYVIGNEEGTSFTSANSDRGTRTVQGQKRVVVYATKRDAIEYAERPRDNDPNDPTSPQPQPEEEDDPTPRPSLPQRPDYELIDRIRGSLMVSTNDLASQRRASDDRRSQTEAEALSIEESRNVKFGKWVEVDYDKSLKTVYQRFKDGDSNPFSNMIIGGSFNEYTTAGSLLMEDSDTYGTSSYFKAVLGAGWMVQFNLLTSNENYFTSETDTALLDRLDFDDSPSGAKWVEEIDFSLFEEGDYLSLDIDNESSQVGQFSLVIGGVKYSVDSPSKMDDEAKVWLRKVYYFDPDAGLAKFEGETTIEDDEIEGDDTIIEPEPSPEDDDDDDDDEDDDDKPPIEVSGFAMLALLASVGGVLFLALRRGA